MHYRHMTKLPEVLRLPRGSYGISTVQEDGQLKSGAQGRDLKETKEQAKGKHLEKGSQGQNISKSGRGVTVRWGNSQVSWVTTEAYSTGGTFLTGAREGSGIVVE